MKTEKPRCLNCGNNPISHTQEWIDGTISIAITSPIRLFHRTHIQRVVIETLRPLQTPFINLLERIGIVRYEGDVTKARTDREKFIWEEAIRRGLKMERLELFKQPNPLYRVWRNGKRYYFSILPNPPRVDSEAALWMDDKALLKDFYLKHDIPVPPGGQFTSKRKLLKKFRELTKPVIVKPRVGSRGRHTTTHIYTEDDVVKAFDVARQLCRYVVMEEHLYGSVYRGTVIDGVLRGVLRGDPPRVTGDGRSTISELIDQKNKTRNERVKDVVLKDTHLKFLARSGYTPDTVLEAGKTIDLIEKIGLSYGGNAVEEIDIAHKDFWPILERAASLLKHPLIGFDFIVEDITKSPYEQRWGIIEANSAPFINLHHDPNEGRPLNVAQYVWDLWEKHVDLMEKDTRGLLRRCFS